MIDKLLRLFKTEENPPNDFENLVLPNEHVNLVLSNGVIADPSSHNTVARDPKVAGQHISTPIPGVKDGIYINLHAIMHSSDSREEVITRLIETEIHEMMHWGDESTGDDRYSGPEHQEPFNNVIYDILSHCDQNYYDFRDPISKYEWLGL